MAKIIKFNPEGGKPKRETKEEKKEPKLLKGSLEKAEPLTEEDFQRLFHPFREGLKRLYPSQVEEVLGYTGLGEKNGDKAFIVGMVIWKRYGVEQPYTSTFVALFENGELKKVSFLEAKNNYWDWKTMLKVHKGEFHTEELFKRFNEIVRSQFGV